MRRKGKVGGKWRKNGDVALLMLIIDVGDKLSLG